MISLDLKRLLDHEVELFGFDLERVWAVIQTFVDYCDRYSVERGDIQVAGHEELERLRKRSPSTFLLARMLPEPPMVHALTELLRHPRILKHAMRRTWLVWQSLHGEVSLEDLLVYSTIRTVSYSARSFIRDRWHLLATPDRQKKTDLKAAWESWVSDCGADEEV